MGLAVQGGVQAKRGGRVGGAGRVTTGALGEVASDHPKEPARGQLGKWQPSLPVPMPRPGATLRPTKGSSMES